MTEQLDDAPVGVEFWFDPVCPFTWLTSRWLVEVAAARQLSVTWHVMSLTILHTGELLPAGDHPTAQQAVRVLRTLVAAEDAAGQEGVGKLFTLLGSRRHDGGEEGKSAFGDAGIRAAVRDAGLPDAVAAAADDASLDARIRESHDAGQRRSGMETGSPVLALDGGRGYFGPVVVPAPSGADALRLFDAVRLLSSVPAFSEFKTARPPLD